MDDAEKTLRRIASKVFLIDENKISDEMSRGKLKTWDSMAQLVLITEIESAFQVMLSDDDIATIKTYADIKRVLKKLGVDV